MAVSYLRYRGCIEVKSLRVGSRKDPGFSGEVCFELKESVEEPIREVV